MKILKPGKVEMRKFVCPNCECEFVIYKSEADRAIDLESNYHYWAKCPCRNQIAWDNGESYEEQNVQDEPERIANLIYECCATDAETAWETAKFLVENGVTFREMPNENP